jgi:hypothetical protein
MFAWRNPTQNPACRFPAPGSPGRTRSIFAAIRSSCVDIRFLPLSAGDVSPDQHLDLPRRFPLYTAFPCPEYYQRV